jgi:hypothetical protein
MDDVDLTLQRQEAVDGLCFAAAQRAVKEISEGTAGECDLCGKHNARLMGSDYFKKNGRYDIANEVSDGICSRCRDKHRLP